MQNSKHFLKQSLDKILGMKKSIAFYFTAILLGALNGTAQDSNILLGLDPPASGVTIKTSWPAFATGGWARGYSIANQDASERFIQLGTYGTRANGITTEIYSFIGPVYSAPYITFLPNSNVGIGTTSPDERLSVNGRIRAKEVKVEMANWPDYVFEESYQLRDLKELKRYLSEHKHLPDVPSATEINKNGIELGQMNSVLVKKIEELTLYIIQQDERLTRLEEENSELKDIINRRE